MKVVLREVRPWTFRTVCLSRLVLKEQVTPMRLWALAFGFVGLLLLLWPDIRAVGAAPAGALFMLRAAFCRASPSGSMNWRH